MEGIELLAELNKSNSKIEELLKSYDYSVYIDAALMVERLKYTYGAQIKAPQASIISLLELYLFLEEEQGNGIVLKSKDPTSKIIIDEFTTFSLLSSLSKLIQKSIAELNQTQPFMENIYTKYKTKEITFKMYLSFFKSTYIDKHTLLNESTSIIFMYKIFKKAGMFTSNKVNQKGTTKLSNKEGAFLYDMLLLIKDKEINNIPTDKEKSDYIRYRLGKLELI